MAQPTTSSSGNISPWGKKETCQVKSFVDVMDEEYAKELVEKDIRENEEKYAKQFDKTVEEVNNLVITPEQNTVCDEELDLATAAAIAADDSPTTDDLLLAKMLQQEFDQENDQYIKSMEKNYNKSSKVSISMKNYYSQHPYDMAVSDELENFDDDSDDSEDEELDIRRPTGRVKFGEEIITKHDSLISERKNTKNLEQFPSNFQSGDVNEDIRLPNHVYNKLKIHSMKEEQSNMRLHEKQEHSTHEKALDENTRLILYKMVNNGTLDILNGIIATGKESVLIYAKGGSNDDGPLPTECALKVYKTTLNEFKTREKYIREDYRFRERFSKQNPRKIVKLWAEKEYRNLKRMGEAGLNCPKAVLLRKHIVVMSFVGFEGKAAPKLKEAHLNKNQLTQAYLECIKSLQLLYSKCNLIHADFSEYNVLWHDNKCWFIDVSQSVEPEHPQAFHFLLRDCENVTRFFKKSGVNDVMTEEELFQYVCGKDLNNVTLDEMENECKENFESNKERLAYGIDTKDFAFDYHFKQTELSNKQNNDKDIDDIIEDDTNTES